MAATQKDIISRSAPPAPEPDERIRLGDLSVAEFLGLLARLGATPPTPQRRENYTIRQAAEACGVGERQVRRWLATGRLNGRKVVSGRGSSRVLIARSELDRVLGESEVA